MPNMLNDNLLDEAFNIRQWAQMPTNPDYQLQNAVSGAINTAAGQGLFTCTVSVAAYASSLVQLLIKRLIDMGYTSATLSGTTLTVSWL